MSESKHTPGPWRWEINLASKSLHLVGGAPKFDLTVMDFKRWGMGGSTARLRDLSEDGMNIMHKVHERPDWIAPFEGREHHADWCADITHPDMVLIASAPDLAAEVERLKSALTKISGIRDSMIGCQKVNWSEHVYPLVAALDAAGFEGASYEVARDQIGTLLERTNKAEAEVERLRAEHEGPDSWEANAKHLLARCPYTVRQCPGGGPEDIKSSLVVTFMGMQQDLAAERRKVDALQCRVEDLESSLRALLIHIDAYRMGWMGGVDKWRDRIGLADDVEAARAALAA